MASEGTKGWNTKQCNPPTIIHCDTSNHHAAPVSANCARHAKQRERRLPPPSIACLEVVRWGDMRCKLKTAPSPPLTPSLLQVCEQLMTMHLAGRRSAAGKPSPGKSHLLRHSQLAAGVPNAIVSHTKGHADVSTLYLSTFGFWILDFGFWI